MPTEAAAIQVPIVGEAGTIQVRIIGGGIAVQPGRWLLRELGLPVWDRAPFSFSPSLPVVPPL